MEITALQFEEMIDRLEKGSGQQVSVSLHAEKYWFSWYFAHISVFVVRRISPTSQIVFYSVVNKILFFIM